MSVSKENPEVKRSDRSPISKISEKVTPTNNKEAIFIIPRLLTQNPIVIAITNIKKMDRE